MVKRKAVDRAVLRRKNKLLSRRKNAGVAQRKGPHWYFLDKSGLLAIWEHFEPPTEEEKKGRRPPATIVLWFAGIYTAVFGLASARYENAADRLELRASSVVALLANDNVRSQACAQIGEIQGLSVPYRPEFWIPGSILRSFVSEFNTDYQESIDMLAKAVESCKEDLRQAQLGGAKLHGAILGDAELVGADLRLAELPGAYLARAKLAGADLLAAKLGGAILSRGNFEGAKLSGAKLHGAYLVRTKLSGADMGTVKLHGATLESAELSGAKLRSAELSGAYLRSADFTCVDLTYSHLEGIRSWETVSFSNCNIWYVQNAPEGFREWALWNGAVEMDPEEWKRFGGHIDLITDGELLTHL